MTASAFTYWNTNDTSPLDDVIVHWSQRVGELAILGDLDAIRVLDGINRSFVDTYERLRIPAARSDVARLAILYDRGGLYIDSHCGIVGENILEVLNRAKNTPVMLVNQSRMQFSRPVGHLNFINAIIAGGKKSRHLLDILLRIIDNLERHREYERVKGFKPYNLLDMTGPSNINALTLDFGGGGAGVRDTLHNHVQVEEEDEMPIRRYQFKLKSNGAHWSERQKTERLFVL
ncbi:glycosyltransferase [Methylobacterium radiotolerans]